MQNVEYQTRKSGLHFEIRNPLYPYSAVRLIPHSCLAARGLTKPTLISRITQPQSKAEPRDAADDPAPQVSGRSSWGKTEDFEDIHPAVISSALP